MTLTLSTTAARLARAGRDRQEGVLSRLVAGQVQDHCRAHRVRADGSRAVHRQANVAPGGAWLERDQRALGRAWHAGTDDVAVTHRCHAGNALERARMVADVGDLDFVPGAAGEPVAEDWTTRRTRRQEVPGGRFRTAARPMTRESPGRAPAWRRRAAVTENAVAAQATVTAAAIQRRGEVNGAIGNFFSAMAGLRVAADTITPRSASDLRPGECEPEPAQNLEFSAQVRSRPVPSGLLILPGHPDSSPDLGCGLELPASSI